LALLSPLLIMLENEAAITMFEESSLVDAALQFFYTLVGRGIDLFNGWLA
jgi:hypothetical protein